MVSHTFSDCAFLCFIYSNKWERFWNQKNDVFANTGRLRQCIPHEGILVLYSPQELDFMTVTVTGTLAKANQVHLHTWDLHHKVHDAFGHGVNQFASVWPCGTALQAWHNLVWEFWSAKWRLTMVKYESSNDLSRFQQGMNTCFQELMKVLCTHTMLIQHHFNHQDFGIISPSAKSKSKKTSTSKKTAKIIEQVTLPLKQWLLVCWRSIFSVLLLQLKRQGTSRVSCPYVPFLMEHQRASLPGALVAIE